MPRKKTAIPDEQPAEILISQAGENQLPGTFLVEEGVGTEPPPTDEAPDGVPAGPATDVELPGTETPGAFPSDVPMNEEPSGNVSPDALVGVAPSHDGAPDTSGDLPPDEENPFPDSASDADNPHPQDDMAPENDDPEYGALLQEWSSAEHSDGDSEAPLTLDPPPDDAPASDPSDTAEPEENRTDEKFILPAHPASQSHRTENASSPVAGPYSDRVLTIEAGDEIRTAEEQETALWHEIQNAHWTRRILTGTLDGVEQTESGMTVAVANYKGFRIVIPVKEMLLYTGRFPSGKEYAELMTRMRGILAARLGSEIDFIVKGHENRTRSVVASRKDAMYRKRQIFYLDTDETGKPMIREGRIVQARVVAVAEKVIRVEVFGVECVIVARDLSRAWMGNAAEQYHVGDRILVRVQKINGTTAEDLSIAADVRSISPSSDGGNLKKCVRQGRYAGRVTDVRGGVLYIRLNNGVNAIAHSCYDRRMPGKGDDVSFAVTKLDEEQGVAVGLITRVIKQNL